MSNKYLSQGVIALTFFVLYAILIIENQIEVFPMK
nr:MAG TPA: hypothetical protein [Caudoviricetes sp.]